MIELIETDKKLIELIGTTTLLTLVSKAVAKAYKSGLCQFNALTHDMVEEHSFRHILEEGQAEEGIELLTCQWKNADIDFNTGEKAMLINTYLQTNGYVS